jgi:PAS domain S-box-containing protein
MDRFVARENIKHFRHQLEKGADGSTRASLLKLLVEEETRLGLTREQLNKLERHISRLSELTARQVELIDGLQSRGQPAERAQMVLETFNDLMATYTAHQHRIKVALGDLSAGLEAREAEQQLPYSPKQLAILLQSITDYAIYMLDTAGRILTWNSGAERMKGYTRDEIRGQHFSRFYTDFDLQSELPTKSLRQAAADGKFEGEGWRVRKDGTRFWASVVIDPVYDDSGALIGFAKVIRDVTERHRAQELLEQRNKELEILANTLQRERDNKLINAQAIVAAISHEVRQPLTRITAGGNAAQRFLKMVPPAHDKAQAALEGIVAAGHRASDVIDGFRTLFAEGDQRQQLVDLNEIVRDVLKSLSTELNDHNVELRSELISEPPHVNGNGSQLHQVVSNLTVNAIEAMQTTSDRSRVLHVRTELRSPNAVAVIVRDSGMGIEQDKLDGIFAAFVSTKANGNGLGLAISRMIIDYHGGKLTALSDGKDGATFQFVLPIASSDMDRTVAE